ncbi:MAG: site-2 protease family protein [Sumerlaeia bacterium]
MFQNSVKIGRLFGIDLGFTPFWLMIYLFFSLQMAGVISQGGLLSTQISTPLATGLGFLLIGLLYVSIIAHEYGHSLTARIFGINTKRIILHVFGGVALLEGEPKSPKEEFWITIMGPAVSFFLALLFLGFYFLSLITGFEVGQLGFGFLATINGFMFVFNLLPGFPMDGGRLVRAGIWAFTGDYLKSTRIAGMGGKLVGYSIAALGVYRMFFTEIGIFNGVLNVMIGFFIANLASRVVKEAEFTNIYRNKTVRDYLRPNIQVLQADATVYEAGSLMRLFMNQEMFPVVHNNKIIGHVSQQILNTVQPHQYHWVHLGEICQPIETNRIISADLLAINALEKLSAGKFSSLAVFEGRKLLGFIYGVDLMNQR